MKKDILVLEPSTNTHQLEATQITAENLDQFNAIKLIIKGNGLVTHGTHGLVCTESKHVIKIVQQEFNPVTQSLQNSFD